MKISQTNDGMRQYLSIELCPDQTLDHYEYKMLGTRQDFLLNCQLADQQTETLLYNIAGRQSIIELMHSQSDLRRILNWLNDICDSLLRLEEYLLNPQRVLCQAAHIYIDPISDQISLVYLPFQTTDNGDITSCISDLIRYAHQKNASSYQLNRLYSYALSAEFCISGFQRLVQSIIQDENGSLKAVTPSDDQLHATPQQKTTEPAKNIQKSYKKSLKLLQLTDNSKKVLISTFILVHILLVLICIVLWQLINGITADLFEARLGLCLIVGSIEILILKFYASRVGFNWQGLKRKDMGNRSKRKSLFKKPVSAAKAEQSNANHTAVLANHMPQAHIVQKTNEQVYPLSGEQMVLGRKGDEADIILTHPTIGRQHCLFKMQDSQYQIVDLFSKNGTFVNGVQIEVQQPVSLQHGDDIRLADLEFKYYAY